MADEKNMIEKMTETSAQPLQETMEKFLSAADVRAVFGEPVEHGETLIIPTAEVVSGMGFGMGFGGGEGPMPEGEAESTGSGGGGGGGGGGRVLSRPVAVVIADQHGVRVEPIVDPTKIAIALFTTIGFMAAVAGRMKGKKPRLEP